MLANNEKWSAPMTEAYDLLGIDPASVQVSVNADEEFAKIIRRRRVDVASD